MPQETPRVHPLSHQDDWPPQPDPGGQVSCELSCRALSPRPLSLTLAAQASSDVEECEGARMELRGSGGAA